MRVAEVIVTNSFVNNLHIYINIYIYMIASLNLILDKSVIESWDNQRQNSHHSIKKWSNETVISRGLIKWNQRGQLQSRQTAFDWADWARKAIVGIIDFVVPIMKHEMITIMAEKTNKWMAAQEGRRNRMNRASRFVCVVRKLHKKYFIWNNDNQIHESIY